MKKISASITYRCASVLGEGALWDERQSKLLWVDIAQGHLHRFDPKSGTNETFEIGVSVGSVALEDEGDVVLAVRNGIGRYDTKSNVLEMLVTMEHENKNVRFNDGKCDPAGRFWAGTLSEDGASDIASLFCLENDLSLSCKISRVGISNGICWSPEKDTMYYIDSMSQNVVAYRYSCVDGGIHSPRVVVEIDIEEGTPDGMCVDVEGMLWVALWGGGKVIRIHPRTGNRLLEVYVPNASKVTSCAFGGENLTTLFITTARQGLTSREESEQMDAGSLFMAEVGIQGLSTNLFRASKLI